MSEEGKKDKLPNSGLACSIFDIKPNQSISRATIRHQICDGLHYIEDCLRRCGDNREYIKRIDNLVMIERWHNRDRFRDLSSKFVKDSSGHEELSKCLISRYLNFDELYDIGIGNISPDMKEYAIERVKSSPDMLESKFSVSVLLGELGNYDARKQALDDYIGYLSTEFLKNKNFMLEFFKTFDSQMTNIRLLEENMLMLTSTLSTIYKLSPISTIHEKRVMTGLDNIRSTKIDKIVPTDTYETMVLTYYISIIEKHVRRNQKRKSPKIHRENIKALRSLIAFLPKEANGPSSDSIFFSIFRLLENIELSDIIEYQGLGETLLELAGTDKFTRDIVYRDSVITTASMESYMCVIPKSEAAIIYVKLFTELNKKTASDPLIHRFHSVTAICKTIESLSNEGIISIANNTQEVFGHFIVSLCSSVSEISQKMRTNQHVIGSGIATRTNLHLISELMCIIRHTLCTDLNNFEMVIEPLGGAINNLSVLICNMKASDTNIMRSAIMLSLIYDLEFSVCELYTKNKISLEKIGPDIISERLRAAIGSSGFSHVTSEVLKYVDSLAVHISDNYPEEFMDALTCGMLENPVILPNTGQIVNRETIIRCLSESAVNPFSGSHLSIGEVDRFNSEPRNVEKILDIMRRKKEWDKESESTTDKV